MVPDYMLAAFTPLSNVYSNNGRESRGSTAGNFAPGTGGKTEWGRRRFASHGVNLWNGLPKDTKAISKLQNFKTSVKYLAKNNYKFYRLKW